MSGSDTINQNGIYGTKGTPSASNIPGARHAAVSWTDSAGNLWLFGGYGLPASGTAQGNLNDLWKFTPSTGQWTWVSGSDTINQNGIYGTKGTPSASNIPGGRYVVLTGTDSAGNLWLFGGNGYPAPGSTNGRLNDLWKFTLSTGQWTWVSGSDTISQNGTYGTLGTADPGSIPGGRNSAVSWTDSAGKPVAFRGIGIACLGRFRQPERSVEITLSTGQWTWVSGSDTINQNGIYGTKGTADPGNTPGGRTQSVSWTDSAGNLWLFGGLGLPASGTVQSFLNDLWRY